MPIPPIHQRMNENGTVKTVATPQSAQMPRDAIVFRP
jgi:hypothetical protein